MGHADHKKKSRKSVRCLVVTVSDTRTADTDESGRLICDALKSEGHSVAGRLVVRDDRTEIERVFEGIPSNVDAVIFNGGTGISRRDCTYEVVTSRLDKELPGFGELFRALSYAEIGSAAMMSRATAGAAGGRVIISLPGSTGAVRLALEKLILPELSHMVWEVGR
ncbi:MAG: molybdenum cofactor biosynthesis protein B [bacterium]